jgi:hypothetical protein
VRKHPFVNQEEGPWEGLDHHGTLIPDV